MTIENKTATTILETPIEVKVGAKTYMAAPPTTATLIRVSELVATLPKDPLDQNNVFAETLRIARDCRVLGDIVAVLILGNKTEKPTWWERLTGKATAKANGQHRELATEIIETLSPKQINSITVELLKTLEISDFFGLTTSLIEVNLTKGTREVVN